jgi:hypothetical protein
MSRTKLALAAFVSAFALGSVAAPAFAADAPKPAATSAAPKAAPTHKSNKKHKKAPAPATAASTTDKAKTTK